MDLGLGWCGAPARRPSGGGGPSREGRGGGGPAEAELRAGRSGEAALPLRNRNSSSSSRLPTRPMARIRLCHYSTTPVPRPRPLRGSSSSTSPSSRSWSPRAAFSAATERVRAGTFSPEDAHHLFDDMLRQATPVPERSLSGFLAALARAPAYDDRRSGPTLAVTLFNRLRRQEAGPQVALPTVYTYNIIMDCCCRASRPDLGLAFFSLLLRTGLKTNQIVATTLLKCLCYAKRTDEALNVLLHKMSKLGCVPNAVSYSTVLKGLCDDIRSQRALDLLQMMAKEGGPCSPNVVAYNTVIYGFLKEGEVSKACNLFHEMMQQGVEPNVL